MRPRLFRFLSNKMCLFLPNWSPTRDSRKATECLCKWGHALSALECARAPGVFRFAVDAVVAGSGDPGSLWRLILGSPRGTDPSRVCGHGRLCGCTSHQLQQQVQFAGVAASRCLASDLTKYVSPSETQPSLFPSVCCLCLYLYACVSVLLVEMIKNVLSDL